MLNGSSQLPLKLLLILMFNIMKTEKEFTVIGRAMTTVAGFDRVYRSLEQQVTLRGQAKSTFENYIHRIAQVSQHFNCLPEPSLGNARQVVNYLGQYTHRVAISNTRIKNMDSNGVTFSYKDYADNANQKLMTLSGVEFLRRFVMHILPRGFVKIRYFGILTSAYRQQVESLKTKPDIFQLNETRQQRIVRLTGLNPCKCPKCKTGTMIPVEIIPRIRSPDNVFYPRMANQNL